MGCSQKKVGGYPIHARRSRCISVRATPPCHLLGLRAWCLPRVMAQPRAHATGSAALGHWRGSVAAVTTRAAGMQELRLDHGGQDSHAATRVVANEDFAAIVRERNPGEILGRWKLEDLVGRAIRLEDLGEGCGGEDCVERDRQVGRTLTVRGEGAGGRVLSRGDGARWFT